MEQAKEQEKGIDGVRAVGRALDVLLAFTRNDLELTASELAQRVDLSRATLYRLLYTLETKGFIRSIGDPQRFTLGPAVAKLAQVWSTTQEMTQVAEPLMRELWEETQETVALWVRQGGKRFCVAELPSPQALNLTRGVGSNEMIARGASGRAILAFSHENEADIDAHCSVAGLTGAAFRAELQATRERGYATSRDELIAGAVAVAAPFFDRHGVAGSIGVFGPSVRLRQDQVEALGARVAQQAARLSQQLGAELPAAAAPRKAGR